MLVFVLILAIVFVALVVFASKKWDYIYRRDWEFPTGLFLFLFGVTLLASLVVWAVAPPSWRADIADYKATKTSIQNARAQGLSELERVSIQDKVIEYNAWLARAQYQDKHFWIECIPSEIQDLTPIE